jgi:transcriptional regulator with XRE-family HTH domain
MVGMLTPGQLPANLVVSESTWLVTGWHRYVEVCLIVNAGASMTDFGQLLKTLRERRGVSQSKLAEKAEFDHSYVSRLESAARMPTRDAVDRLGSALELSDVELDSLLAAAGFLPKDVANLLTSEPVLSEVLELLQDESVPAEYRENMRQLLRLLAQQARFAVQLRAGGAGMENAA